jgi:cell division protein FtsN
MVSIQQSAAEEARPRLLPRAQQVLDCIEKLYKRAEQRKKEKRRETQGTAEQPRRHNQTLIECSTSTGLLHAA